MRSVSVFVWGMALVFCSAWVLPLSADQVIYVAIGNFDPGLSQFGVEVKGNTWGEFEQEGSLYGTSFGGPGDNNHGSDGGEPFLVVKLPVNVQAGESTADGKVWDAWARVYVPEALNTIDQYNSFFLRVSPDAKSWIPGTGGSTALRFNDPGITFPTGWPAEGLLFTDAGDSLPWWWQKHTANGQSSIDPTLSVGVNYIEVAPRESDTTNFPQIDVICLRNDGGQPSDAEARQSVVSVEPQGKLTSLWAELKATH